MTSKKEKTNFSLACNLLSQYVKQNGSLGNLVTPRTHESRGSSRAPTTMSLLPGAIVAEEEEDQENKDIAISNLNDTKSMELFPLSDDDDKRSENAPLTIFYGGRVIVFENFPADKAKDLMQLASKGLAAKQEDNSGGLMNGTLATSMPSSTSGEHLTAAQDCHARPQPKPNSSNLPIARRASLHRFFEKRKERMNAKAPYQVISPLAPPCKPEDGKSWLGLGSLESNEGDQCFDIRR